MTPFCFCGSDGEIGHGINFTSENILYEYNCIRCGCHSLTTEPDLCARQKKDEKNWQ